MPLTPQELRQRRLALSATPTKAAPDAKALLDAANSASQTVAALHIAFMAVCAYVLVIVFGTTDLDLLMGGNNVKLPVIDVAVPIVGFYAFAPYLVVLMHLNLLLQLQLLSRKLFAFDAATPAEKGVGGLRDRLHIFPYTYYLVGRPGAVVGGLLGLVVSVSLIVLPLATLLGLQLKFLAYQAAGTTWAQRLAVFLDVGLLLALWPVILHRRDDWKAWWRETLAAHLPRKWAWVAVIMCYASVALILFGGSLDLFAAGFLLGAALPLLLIVPYCGFPRERMRRATILITLLWGLIAAFCALVWSFENSLKFAILATLLLCAQPMAFLLPLALFWHPTAPRGSLALLSALVLAPLLTLGLIVDGEGWEIDTFENQKPLLAWRTLSQWLADSTEGQLQGLPGDRCISIGQTVLSCVTLTKQRRLDLNEQALFAKPPNPELRAALQAGNGLENKDKLERISLVDRSLRRAQMASSLLVGADLRGAQLQGANLSGAQLQGANLSGAQLQGANLSGAQLQGANLTDTQLQGANLSGAQLQGANLTDTQLQGANLFWAQLEGANLTDAQLQGADLTNAWLQGADLRRAQLQGADLTDTWLQGADLTNAWLQGADLRGSKLYLNSDHALTLLLDMRGTSVVPLSREELSKIQAMLKSISSSYAEKKSLERLKLAAKRGTATLSFISCLTDGKSQPKCQQAYDVTNPDQRREFMNRLHESLAALACEDADTAQGILRQIPFRAFSNDNDSTRDAYIVQGILRQIPFRAFSNDNDSTREGLATVLLARMKASEPCPGLAGLSAEYKAELERLAKEEEAERQQAAKAASTVRQ